MREVHIYRADTDDSEPILIDALIAALLARRASLFSVRFPQE